jgi:hypothetical protein
MHNLSEVNSELGWEWYKGRNLTKFLIMHCYDLMLRVPRGGRESTLLFCGFLEETTTFDQFWC